MKLLFLIENNEPHSTGGGYYAIFKFAEFLAKNGHDVLIYAVYDHQWISEASGLKIVYRPKIRHKNKIYRKLDKLTDYICDIFLLKNLIKKFKPDFLLGVLKEPAIKAVSIGRQLGVPVANFIYECPPWLLEIYGQQIIDQQPAYTRRLWEKTRKAYLQSDILFPNSELARSYNKQWLEVDTISEPIFPGIDPLQMPYEPIEKHEAQQSILFVGRLAKEKNVHHLIQAWKQMPADKYLHIAGTGPEMASLQQLAGNLNNVMFHGFVSDDELWNLYRKCDLLVCPSNFEGFGMPPMQALYFGKPCLVSDIPIFHSIYGDYVDYFELGNVSQLVKEILRILGNNEYLKEKGRAGRAYVLDNFTWELSAKKIESILLGFQKTIE